MIVARRTFVTALSAGAAALVAPVAGAQAPAAPAQPAAPPAPKRPPSPGEQIAARVQAFYDKTKTYKAKFKQVFTVPAHNKTKESTGQLFFQKPGKMSWRYTNNGNRIVSDGRLLKVYEKDNKQMYEQSLAKSHYPAALAFLVGTGSLLKSFKFTKLDSQQMKFEGGHVLLAEPLEPNPAYRKMLLYVDHGTSQVRRVLLLDAQGNKNRFDFLGPQVNVPVPAGEFAFTPPPGTQVVRP